MNMLCQHRRPCGISLVTVTPSQKGKQDMHQLATLVSQPILRTGSAAWLPILGSLQNAFFDETGQALG